MKVKELTAADVVWSFTDGPRLRLGPYATEPIDPTPCYAHDRDEVRRAVDSLEGLFDIRSSFYIAHFEGTGRTNGWATTVPEYDSYDRNAERYTRHLYYVFLSGKRVPPHPAVTRYLVAHEFGHNVQYWLEHRWGLKTDELLEPYRRIRETPVQPYYGPGTWHMIPGEHFANDFRICVAGVQEEFWPHPGVERPTDELREWWQVVVADPSRERYDELLALAGDVA